MSKPLTTGIFNLIFGILLVVSGVLTIDVKILPTRLGEATVFLDRKAAWFIGGITLLCSIVPLYLGINALLKSRRS